jgi:hypothetical protein
MTGKSSLLLERRYAGAGTNGVTWINGLETMSGCNSDSATSQSAIDDLLYGFPTLVADQKYSAAMFGDAQSMVLHAG